MTDTPLKNSSDLPDEQAQNAHGRSWRNRPLLIVSLLAAIVIVVILAWRLWPSKTASDPAATNTPVEVSVQVAKAERRAIASQVSAVGTIFPREQATVSAKVAGQIKRMALLKNRDVKAGEAVVTLESRDLQSQRNEALAALNEARLTARALTTGAIPQAKAQEEKTLRDARANLANAKMLYERREELHQKGGISQKDLEAARLALTLAEDELRLTERSINLRETTISPNERALAEARVKQAEERVAALDAQLSYTVIRAPFSGVITDQYQYEGEFASPGGRLFTIADLSEMIVKVPLADSGVAQLKVGDPATVLPADLPGEQLTGRISLISRGTDPLNRTVEVCINLKNPGGRLRAGGAAQVMVAAQAVNDAAIVPFSAVTLDAANSDQGTVMVVDAQSVAHEVKVTVGIRTESHMQILSGLQGGETIIVEGNYTLPDGTKVQVNNSQAGGKQ